MSLRSALDFPWCNTKNRWHSIHVALTFIFRMSQQAYHLPLLLLRRPIHSLWKDVTMPPMIAECGKTVNRWHSIDAHVYSIETAFVHPIIVRNDSYTHYWHPILRLYVLSFASRSFITSQFLISGDPRYLIERWRGPITFPRFRPAIDGM
jgi:hypothetical protein